MAAGFIYSRSELQRLGLRFDSTHYYGDAEKEATLSRYVSCATMPPWGMMQDEREELAILGLNPSVVATPGTCFCPGWSPLATFEAADIITWADPEHAEALYTGPGYTTVRGAEIFVPAAVPVSAVEEIVYYDREGAERSRAQMIEAIQSSGTRIGHTIQIKVELWRFPRHWQEAGPPWAQDQEADEPTI
jgi:hypothetical protein